MVTTDEVRQWALSLPEAELFEHWGKPSFRVRNKIFAVIQPDHVSVVMKTSKDDRIAYTTMAPDVFQMPSSFTHLAFMLVRLDRIDPDEFRPLLIAAWKHATPKKMHGMLSDQ